MAPDDELQPFDLLLIGFVFDEHAMGSDIERPRKPFRVLPQRDCQLPAVGLQPPKQMHSGWRIEVNVHQGNPAAVDVPVSLMRARHAVDAQLSHRGVFENAMQQGANGRMPLHEQC